jgi:predicted nucleic acid-binding protein
MPFLLDTTIPACWAFQDEQSATADAAFARIQAEEAVVPSLWWFEIRNILVVNERRKRITEADTLARTHRLSDYDASYLELALREGIPLATLDAELITAARAEGSGLI